MNASDKRISPENLAGRAVFDGKVEDLKKALELGADPNGLAGSVDFLTHALIRNHKEVRDVLLKEGATPNHPDSCTWHFLAFRLEMANLKYLVNRFPFEEEPDSQNRTPLEFLVDQCPSRCFNSKNFWKMALFLVELGSDTNRLNEDSVSVLQRLCIRANRHKHPLDFFSFNELLSSSLSHGFSPNAGGSLNIRGAFIHEPLSIPAVKLLLEYGADVDLPSGENLPVDFRLMIYSDEGLALATEIWKNGSGLNRIWESPSGPQAGWEFLQKQPPPIRQKVESAWIHHQQFQLNQNLPQSSGVDLKKSLRL